MQLPQSIQDTLASYGQTHLVTWWDDLNDAQQQALLAQLEEIDFPLMERLFAQRDASSADSAAQSSHDRAAKAEPPENLLRLPKTDADRSEWNAAESRGLALLQAGKVGAILVAGGQGTRLGFDKPKGMFPIGPVSNKMLFQMHCEQLAARSRDAEAPIPYFIMTSAATHADTVACFEENNWFGLPKGDVYFFQQGSMPAVDHREKKILLAEKHRIATSPDGHGGILKALAQTGMLDVMRDRGLEYLYYHQVDNPTAIMCDPVFLGFHEQTGSDMSTKVVAKESAAEKMGVMVSVDGQTEIIEYSDLPDERAQATDDEGNLLLWAGNTAIHAFSLAFLERLKRDGIDLPYHIAHKPVPCLNDDGAPVEPDDKNANKFEQFIFDALPEAATALVVEADRDREFNPVKNAEGKDSPATSRDAMIRLHRQWLQDAGAEVADGVVVEISPLYALDARQLAAKLPPNARFDSDTVLE